MQTSPAGARYYCTCNQIKYKTQEPYPQSRNKHVSCLHDNFVYIYAGKDGNISLRDFWKFNIGNHTWSQVSFRGDNPTHLEGHTLVSYKKLLLLFGGEFGDALTESSLWIVNPDLGYIRKSNLDPGSETPSVRRHHSAVVYRGCMFVYGGYVDMKGSSRELWKYRIDDEEWDLLVPRQPAQDNPSGLYGHSAVVQNKYMWVYGGMSDLVPRQDLWCFNFVSSYWDRVKFKYGPPPLSGHSAVVAESQMYIFGGECNREPVNQLWCFNFKNELWTNIRCDHQIPSARLFHSAVMVSALSKAEDSVKASSMPYLQQKMNHLQLERPRTSPVSGSQGRLHFSDKHFTHKDSRPQVLNLRENSSSCESLKIAPSPSENTKDHSPLVPKITDLNYNGLDVLDKNCVMNGIDNPGISKSTEELIKENQILWLSKLNQENLEFNNKSPFLRSQSQSAQSLLDENKGLYCVRQNSEGLFCTDTAATEDAITEVCAKKFRPDPELIIEDLEYLDCFPYDVKLPYPNSKISGIKTFTGIRQSDALNNDIETIELVDVNPNDVNPNALRMPKTSRSFGHSECIRVKTVQDDVNFSEGKNVESSVGLVNQNFNPYRSKTLDQITGGVVDRTEGTNIDERQYYTRVSDCIDTQTVHAGHRAAVEMQEVHRSDVKLSPVFENRTCETNFCVTGDSSSVIQHSHRKTANSNKANQLDTSPYMLIFGGKEKQGTNFGIKPLTVWKCQIKKS